MIRAYEHFGPLLALCGGVLAAASVAAVQILDSKALVAPKLIPALTNHSVVPGAVGIEMLVLNRKLKKTGLRWAKEEQKDCRRHQGESLRALKDEEEAEADRETKEMLIAALVTDSVVPIVVGIVTTGHTVVSASTAILATVVVVVVVEKEDQKKKKAEERKSFAKDPALAFGALQVQRQV